MPHDPTVHCRRSIRLDGYDYTRAGAYYITICTYRREWLFGDVVRGEMHLSRLGEVVAARWRALPRTFRRVKLDEWVVMPNHFHGVFRIVDAGSELSARADPATVAEMPSPDVDRNGRPHGAPPGSVGAIVGNLKSVATRRINRIRRTLGARLWLRGYWEHIVRNEQDLERIRRYIRANPRRWERDRNRQRPRAEDEFVRHLGLPLRHVPGP